MRNILLLINTGSPDHHDKKSARRYLRQFLSDKRVIQMPAIFRFLLVNMIIVPFRAAKSSALYRRLWTDDGAPLKNHTVKLVETINSTHSQFYATYAAMRYGNPSIESILEIIESQNPDKITVMPLYPHYTAASTGTAIAEVNRCISKWKTKPIINFITEFYAHHRFLDLFADNIRKYNPHSYDHIIFSYHGLPLKNIKNDDKELIENNISLNYTDSCHETTRLLVEKLNLDTDTYTSSFQSRMSKRWLTPFTDSIIASLAHKGAKRILVIAPSFVADCLETTVEIEQDYSALFKKLGGEKLTLVHSLNHSARWADAVVEIAMRSKKEETLNTYSHNNAYTIR